MAGVSIRLATEADLDQVIGLYHAFHAFHVRGMPEWLRIPARYDDEATRADLTAILHNEHAALFVAEHGAALVGLAEVYRRQDEVHPATVAYVHGYLQSLMVQAAWRRRGVGTRLLEAARRWAWDRGATQLRLDTWEFADGPLHFYEALGFQTVKRRLAAPIDGREHVIPQEE